MFIQNYVSQYYLWLLTISLLCLEEDQTLHLEWIKHQNYLIRFLFIILDLILFEQLKMDYLILFKVLHSNLSYAPLFIFFHWNLQRSINEWILLSKMILCYSIELGLIFMLVTISLFYSFAFWVPPSWGSAFFISLMSPFKVEELFKIKI